MRMRWVQLAAVALAAAAISVVVPVMAGKRKDPCVQGKAWAFGMVSVENTQEGEWTELRGGHHCNGEPILVRRSDMQGTTYDVWLVGQAGYKDGFSPSAYHHPHWIASVAGGPDVASSTTIESLQGESSPTGVLLRLYDPDAGAISFTVWRKQYTARGPLPSPSPT